MIEKPQVQNRFEFVGKRYGGNIAYLLVLNSLIFRIPLSWKRYYAPAALTIEAALSPLQNPWLSFDTPYSLPRYLGSQVMLKYHP